MIKRVLKCIFNMCKTMATETNENRRNIIEVKSHLGLPTDPYYELPTFDDSFAEWDTQDDEERQEVGEEEEDNNNNNDDEQEDNEDGDEDFE
jgi:hypothetical protein